MLDPSQPPSTLPEMLQRSFVGHLSRPCLGHKTKGSDYQFATYGEVALRVRHLAGAWLELGLERGERIAILSENRPEWALVDLSCQMAGLVSVPLFSTLPAGQIQTILRDCGAAVIVVSDEKQAAKIAEIRENLPDLKHVFGIENGELAELEKSGDAFLQKNAGLYESTWPATMPDDIATLIYTSGTTGEPKGVMLTHTNFLADLEGVRQVAPHLNHDDVWLSFLPLAHVYERTAGHWLPLRLGASIAYSESLFSVDKNLAEVAPTVMTCVPRFLESSREKMLSGKGVPEGKKAAYLGALKLAEKAGMKKGNFPDAPGLGWIEKLKYKFADGAVYSPIRAKYGGRLKHFISGGAPMSPELGGLFLGLGLEVLEGYGLTETSPVIAVNVPNQPQLGSVGPPLPGVEVKIAEDGEILARGATMMKGYWNKPDATKDALDKDGWFHTGDIGTLDGVLRITGRKKDLLVLANGKKVAPAPIEIALQESPLIEQAVLLGDKQKAVGALLVPKFGALKSWAKEQKLEWENDAELAKLPAVEKLLRGEVEQLTKHLADFEKIRRIAVLEREFSAQEGELTPTLKVKRNVVAEKFGDLIAD